MTCAACGANLETAAADPDLEARCDVCLRIALGVRARTLRVPRLHRRRRLLLLPLLLVALTVAVLFALEAV